MPQIKQVVPFLGVHDIEKSVRFYVDGLGFAMTKKWTPDGNLRWCWLELGDAALMLQEFWKEGEHHNVPDAKLGAGMSLNFLCDDALAVYREMKAKGIAAKKPFVGNGMWVTELADPDGYKLFFESPTDAPEESEYDEADA
jgi:catechol 2,3-dioxygenase-like lactoylglutathione lyase family enzyme